MMGKVETRSFRFYCIYCSHYEITIELTEKTHVNIVFYCGNCNKKNEMYIPAIKETMAY